MTETLSQLKEIASTVVRAAEAESTEMVLERIADVSRELVNAKYAALGVPHGDAGLRYFKVSGMTPEEVAAVGHFPRGTGLLGVLASERIPLRLDDMSKDPRAGGFCTNHPHMTSLLGVPIQVGDRLLGLLYLCDRQDGKPFDERDQWIIEVLAGYAALAIAGTELVEQRKRLTLLEERERISMELHDGIIQSLYAIGMHLTLLAKDPDAAPGSLEVAIEQIDGVIDDIRDYILNLRGKDVPQQSQHDYFDDMLARFNIPSTVEVINSTPKQKPPFRHDVFVEVAQIANEAISNAVRHAEPGQITIGALEADGAYQIIVADDGCGFDLNHAENSDPGLGLRNMQRRARLHRGHIEIKTAPGQGTRVTITVPLKPE